MAYLWVESWSRPSGLLVGGIVTAAELLPILILLLQVGERTLRFFIYRVALLPRNLLGPAAIAAADGLLVSA